MVSNNFEQQSAELQRNLLDNALDFLLSAAESVGREETHRSLKDTVLHLANGTELMVKARLAQEHWSLIFSNLNQASHRELAKADFASVDFPTACKRLEQIVVVAIDKPAKNHIDNLRKLRNRLTHFTVPLDSAQTKSLVAKSMTFCVEFCEQQGMVTPESESKLGEIHMNLTKLQEFVDDRMKSISEEWEGLVIWECPECWQEALIIYEGEGNCAFCKRKTSPQELAVIRSEGHVEDCPRCGTESTLALLLHNNDDGEWVCFSCGARGENSGNCSRCDQLTFIHEVGDFVFCENCMSDLVRRE